MKFRSKIGYNAMVISNVYILIWDDGGALLGERRAVSRAIQKRCRNVPSCLFRLGFNNLILIASKMSRFRSQLDLSKILKFSVWMAHFSSLMCSRISLCGGTCRFRPVRGERPICSWIRVCRCREDFPIYDEAHPLQI